jgi:trk system potassium uptake protein TrkA
MSQQILVIGLGQFGTSFAKAMSAHGHEVIAVDYHQRPVSEIAPFVTEARELNAMDEQALLALAPERRDLCFCAIGDENREASIIVTALLSQMGAKRIFARATDPVHSRILLRVGATEVVNPEQVFGEHLAMRLSWEGVLNALPLGGDLVITEIEAPAAMLGRSLAELSLPSRFSVTVAAVRVAQHDTPLRVPMVPEAHRPFQRGDTLLIVGAEANTLALLERFK